ncbi:hypothetical protein GGS24DRAFT_444532 [Hypoxylon argillaceum]|nr:hypothetical protein GGS24DRAFT_444532 [Hypoxylon argillaceum]
MPDHQTTDRRPQSPPRRQRACLPCTKAKARCHYENNEIGEGCNRCRRLAISCAPQTTRSLRRPRQVKAKDAFEHANASTVPYQEHPHVQAGYPGDQATADSAFGPAMIAPITTRSPQHLQTPNRVSVSTDLAPDSSRNPLERHYSIPFHSKSLPSGPGFGVTWDQAEKAVNDFATIFTAHFPCIILDHDITAQRLFVEKPLLFRAILMIAIDLAPSKSREIRRSVDAWIGQHMLVMEEQSIGALQGLIVYITWANPHFYLDCRATQLMYFAVGLAHSLGITRLPVPDCTQAKKETEINEEHRAFLACYYILSFNSFQFGRPNPLASSYVQYCVESLERSSEFSTDFLLIKLVRFRQFIGRIPTVYEGLCDMKWCREISADASDQLQEIRKDLDNFMSDIAHKHPKLLLLWSLHHSALIQLHLPMTYAFPDGEASSQLQLECMKYCLEASRTFVSMAKSFSPDGFLYAPFTTLTDMISMLIATSRLLLVEIDGWDLKKARQSIDLKTAIDEILVKLKIAGKVKAERVTAAAAAVTDTSSYTPWGPSEEKQDRIQIFARLIESTRDWLDRQGVFLAGVESPEKTGTDELPKSMRIHVTQQSLPWNFTFFFESLLQVDQRSCL